MYRIQLTLSDYCDLWIIWKIALWNVMNYFEKEPTRLVPSRRFSWNLVYLVIFTLSKNGARSAPKFFSQPTHNDISPSLKTGLRGGVMRGGSGTGADLGNFLGGGLFPKCHENMIKKQILFYPPPEGQFSPPWGVIKGGGREY